MYINELLKQNKMSKYRLAKDSGLPQTTITDICSGKASVEKCSALTLYKIAKVLNVSIESIIENEADNDLYFSYRTDFEVFKSNICHLVKDKGDVNFLIDILSEDEIRKLYSRKWYAEAFYLLATVDYLSNVNGIPLCTNYNDIRSHKLKEKVYPAGAVLSDKIMNTDTHCSECLKNAIPEFLRFNIVESEIRNVC